MLIIKKKLFSISVSQGFTKDEQSENSLNGTMYKFSFDQSSIKNEDILNIQQND